MKAKEILKRLKKTAGILLDKKEAIGNLNIPQKKVLELTT